MMNTKPEIELRYSVNALCMAEHALQKRTIDIIQEIESEGGPSINTLRAMLAAGLVWKDPMGKYALDNPSFMQGMVLKLGEAGKIIDHSGFNAVSAEVGKALGAFLRTIGGEA